jgi:hypothetical protein
MCQPFTFPFANDVHLTVMNEPSSETQRQFELAKNELQLALMFAKVSSTAYSQGRLQHAWDARSKAEAVHARAVAQLVGVVSTENKAIESMLGELHEALADLPSSAEPHLWRSAVRRSAV